MGMVHYNRQKSRMMLLRGEMPKWIANSKRKNYIIKVVLSIPPWQPQKELLAMNAEAARLTKLTGIVHHMDHIVPVSHSLVCGLTVPWNLEIRPYKGNLAKSNNWVPGQLSLFDSNEVDLAFRLTND